MNSIVETKYDLTPYSKALYIRSSDNKFDFMRSVFEQHHKDQFDWFIENDIEYDVDLLRPPTSADDNNAVVIHFENDDHAALYKLTWV